MKKKGFVVLVVMGLLFGITSPVAFPAAQNSEWKPARNYPNIYYQLIKRYGGDWDGVRWANQNQYRVKISVKFYYRPTEEEVDKREISLEGGNTYSSIFNLGPNVWFTFAVEKE